MATDQPEDDEEQLWWGEPYKARRFHIFEGETPMADSLCGKWIMSYDPNEVDADPVEDTFSEGDDCKACAREAGLLDGSGEDS